MIFRTLLLLMVLLPLGGCGNTPGTDSGEPARSFDFDWQKEGIRARFEYGTVTMPGQKPVCAGKVSIENYGNRNYVLLMFKVSVFSPSRELIATDRFSLSGTLNPGHTARIEADNLNPLDPVITSKTYRECPGNMTSADVKMDAF